MNPYGFFLDIDGTIMHQGQIHELDRIAIRQAMEAGHFVFINTGRSYACIPQMIEKELELTGFVAGLGADIRMEGNQVYSKTVPLPLLDRVASLLEGIDFFFEGENEMYHQGSMYRRGQKDIKKDIPFSKQYPNARISKFTLFGTPSVETLQELKQNFMYFQFPNYEEMGQLGCTKATGMEWVMNQLGIPMERCIAVGDSANDLHMLQAAGISVAMGNAPDFVKEHCDMVTGRVEEAGVSQVIHQYLLADQKQLVTN